MSPRERHREKSTGLGIIFQGDLPASALLLANADVMETSHCKVLEASMSKSARLGSELSPMCHHVSASS